MKYLCNMRKNLQSSFQEKKNPQQLHLLESWRIWFPWLQLKALLQFPFYCLWSCRSLVGKKCSGERALFLLKIICNGKFHFLRAEDVSLFWHSCLSLFISPHKRKFQINAVHNFTSTFSAIPFSGVPDMTGESGLKAHTCNFDTYYLQCC